MISGRQYGYIENKSGGKMVKEYIDQLQSENSKKLSELENQMKMQMDELENKRRQLEILQLEKNLDVNIFSPRSYDANAKEKISGLQNEMEQIKQEIEYTRELMETYVKKKSEYEDLLKETDIIRSEDDENIKKTDVYKVSELKQFLSDIYSKTELCLALLNSDKNKCKSELRHIKEMVKTFAGKIENTES